MTTVPTFSTAPLFPYAVQYSRRDTACWNTLASYEAYADAMRSFERLVETEHDPEMMYRVLRTEVVNMVRRHKNGQG